MTNILKPNENHFDNKGKSEQIYNVDSNLTCHNTREEGDDQAIDIVKKSASKNIKLSNLERKEGDSSQTIDFHRDNINTFSTFTQAANETNVLEQNEFFSPNEEEYYDSKGKTQQVCNVDSNLICHNTRQEGEDETIDFFKKPASKNIKLFFTFHPVQPAQFEDSTSLPYDSNVYYFKPKNGQAFRRNWISYNFETKKLYCSVCLAYSDGSSVFCQGFDRYRHLTQTVGEHEKSSSHLDSVKSFIAHRQKKSINAMLFEKQLSKRKKEVAERRKVLHGVIDVIKLIGKQGLAFRGSKKEGAYCLDDSSINHGNFLEIFLLLSNYNDIFGNHVKSVIENSKIAMERRTSSSSQNKRRKSGRGSQISFLSKTTISKIMNIIKEVIIDDLVHEIKQAGCFSVMMDTTIDVSGYDQCSIVLRYVFEKEVKEKLLGLKIMQSTSADSLLQTLISMLEIKELKVENCIANSFDGASNMSGEYNGVSAKLKDLVPNHVHTWCYAHVLNLVMSDVSQCLPQTISFFGLLQETQVFIKESFKRLTVYLNQNSKVRLTAIGATRWRAKSDAATKIYGSSTYWLRDTEESNLDTPKGVFLDLIISLSIISNANEFNSKIRNQANALLSKFLSFETVLVAMIFLRIFSSTTPLSDYLQTKNLDFAQAWSFVAITQKALEENRNEFDKMLKAARKFVSYMNAAIEEKITSDQSLDAERLCLESELPLKRTIRIKRVHGDSSEDAFIKASEEEKFKIKIFYRIMDEINQSMSMRFLDKKNLYLDLACFDPRRFYQLKKDGIPKTALDKVCSLIGDIDKAKLKEELISLIDVWPQITSKISQRYEVQLESDKSEDSDTEKSQDEERNTCKPGEECKICIKCVYKVIYDYNMYSVLYTELFKVYKYLLTIPLTQVSCERAFSTLKFIKTRLRSTLSQPNLEALLMMQIEREKLVAIDNDVIITKLCHQSSEMKRLLIF